MHIGGCAGWERIETFSKKLITLLIEVTSRCKNVASFLTAMAHDIRIRIGDIDQVCTVVRYDAPTTY